jgi:hypothetical protein
MRPRRTRDLRRTGATSGLHAPERIAIASRCSDLSSATTAKRGCVGPTGERAGNQHQRGSPRRRPGCCRDRRAEVLLFHEGGNAEPVAAEQCGVRLFRSAGLSPLCRPALSCAGRRAAASPVTSATAEPAAEARNPRKAGRSSNAVCMLVLLRNEDSHHRPDASCWPGSTALSAEFVEVHGVELGGVGDGVDRDDAVLVDGEAKDGDRPAFGRDD